MQLIMTALIASLAGLGLAAPTLPVCRVRRQVGFPNDPKEVTWTLQSVQRTCDEANMACAWSFIINPNEVYQAPTPCTYSTMGTESLPASMATQDGVYCGQYHVSSSWSGQFGPDHGFTTLAVVDEGNRLVAFPAYSDEDLKDGRVVVPDRGFVPHEF